MSNKKEPLFSEFPPVSTEKWMEKVTADLKGADFQKRLVWKTNEGFQVKPMYRNEDIAGMKTLDSLPGEFPFVRGAKGDNDWLVCQEIIAPTFKEANKKAVDVLTKGVNSLSFEISADDVTGENIATLLNDICPESVELNFKTCCKASTKLFKVLYSYFTELKVDVNKVKGSINFDPIGRILRKGTDTADMLDLAAELIEVSALLPQYKVIGINAFLLNNAGAYITQELGFALAWGNDWISRLSEEKGLSPEAVAGKIKFNFGIGSNYFMEIAKFRAARMLWANIVETYQPKTSCAEKMQIHAETSEWNMSIYDAHVNLLRSQTEAMSASLGGVDSLTINPFDITYQQPDDFSERIARNQQLLLKEESHFDKVADPAAGSYYIETLTTSIAQQAWSLFLEIEEKGGFYTALKDGFIQKTINDSNIARHAAVSNRREILLGTNQYPNFSEFAKEKINNPAISSKKSDKETEFQTLNFSRATSDFEALRLDTEKSGKRPKAFMLTIGNLAMRLARAQFACNFLACAGYEVIDNLGFDTVEAGIKAALDKKADIIVLCSSDDEYAELAPKAFKELNNKAIFVVAGAPECMEELKSQGITNFINVRSNVLDVLKEFNKSLGI